MLACYCMGHMSGCGCGYCRCFCKCHWPARIIPPFYPQPYVPIIPFTPIPVSPWLKPLDLTKK